MKFEMVRSDYDDKIKVYLEIDGLDYTRAKLSRFDRLLIWDCETSEKASDKLLALETIVRRIEETDQRDAANQLHKESK